MYKKYARKKIRVKNVSECTLFTLLIKYSKFLAFFEDSVSYKEQVVHFINLKSDIELKSTAENKQLCFPNKYVLTKPNKF